MVDLTKAKDLVRKIDEESGISSATLVSRSGMYVAGKVPEGAHPETFVAMAAILLGSAETAATEINEGLNSITINLKHSRIFVRGATEKTLIVVCFKTDIDAESVNAIVEKHFEGFTDD